MAESNRKDFKYKRDWRAAQEAGPVTEELEQEFLSLAMDIRDREQEKIDRMVKQFLSAMGAIILTSVIFAWRFADGDFNSMGFQLKIMYIVVVQLLVYPFQGVFLLVGYFHLKEKFYFSGIVLILCSLVYVWLGFHQIK